MPELKRYHETPEALHIGCEAPAAYFIPFESAEKAAGTRENSAFFQSLCGEWDFRFYENVARVEMEEKDFPANQECPHKVPVPGNWQLCLGRGYDAPNYINQDYPYPVDPPHLPDVNPCGLYRRDASIAKKEGKAYFLNFEGVSSCFYLWVNGSFAAYSQVSHCSSIVNITPYIQNGVNRFEVLVVKHCDGSYLEDQDFFRLSGIFREVYITERDENGIRDIELRDEVSPAFDSAVLNVTLTSGEEADCTLFAPGGEKIAEGKTREGKASFDVPSAALWNPENPVLYRLLIHSGSEYISLPVGFKRFEIVNSCVTLNGVKVKCKGINRHDSDPETGYWVPPETMMEELYSLKRASVNAIRTSHYPNDPRFLQMCDELGFMVIDEADLECHGMGYNYGDWYWDYWAYTSDVPEWREAYLDRARRLYERDKNHACVIMWSLGNESGCGENHRQMANWIRSRDSRAVIHYENAHLEYEARLNKDFKDISDVESRMYASIEYLHDYLADETQKKPFFYCEYVDSMSTGEIARHWEGVENHDKYFGGCIWELRDHAVNIGTKEKPAYRYGGDFGDWPNDNICCVDGLVYPDRSPRPGYYDMKKVYEPFEATYADGVLRLRNKRYYTDLAEFDAVWEVEVKGEKVQEGRLPALAIEPGRTAAFTLPVASDYDATATLNVYLRLNKDMPWAKAGYEIGFAQFMLCEKAEPLPAGEKAPLTAEETRTDIYISCGKIRYHFDKVLGVVRQITVNGEDTLAGPMHMNLWRAATYNSRGLLDVWKRARYDKAIQKTYGVATEKNGDAVTVIADVSFAAAAMPPAVRAAVRYTFRNDSSLQVSIEAKVTENAPTLPRFGLSLPMFEKYCRTEYFGLGPMETYADRHGAGRLSLYKTTAAEDYDPYVKPQESSSHYKVTRAAVKDEAGAGLGFYAPAGQNFCFKAIPYSDLQVHQTAHHDELQATGKTFVSLDYKISAGNTGTPEEQEERLLSEKEFSFSVIILPFTC